MNKNLIKVSEEKYTARKVEKSIYIITYKTKWAYVDFSHAHKRETQPKKHNYRLGQQTDTH